MKYRKKPVEIEAWQLSKEWVDEQWLKSGYEQKDKRSLYEFEAQKEEPRYFCLSEIMGIQFMIIKTLEGKIRANVGDWIITGVQGELYPCKPDIFELTYEKV